MIVVHGKQVGRIYLKRFMDKNMKQQQNIESTIGTYCLSGGITYYKNKYNNVQPNAKYLEENTITFPCYDGVDLPYIFTKIQDYR